jgi:hypothetical protein
VEFLDYSLRRLPTFSILMIVQLLLILAVLVPLAILNYFVQGDLLLYASSALALLAFFIISIPFELTIPAVVVDNVGWYAAIGRGLKTLLANLPGFFALFLAIKIAEGISAAIPLVGLFITLLLVLPVANGALIMFYRSRRRQQ